MRGRVSAGICVGFSIVSWILPVATEAASVRSQCIVTSEIRALTVWHSAPGLDNIFQALGASFTKQFPGTKVVLRV